MYNDEMYEVSDYDEDIQSRQALIDEVKNLKETADNVDMRIVANLKSRWKRIQYWESAYEDQLREEFDSYIDAFYEKRKEVYQNTQIVKENLIEQAKKLSLSNEWSKATSEMNELMNQWKAAGSAGKNTDDALWESFNEARQLFFERKHKHWEDMQKKFEDARQVKQELIIQAKEFADSVSWQKTSEQFKKLMDKWIAAGSAGKEFEDHLWEEFNQSRQQFYEQRNQHYDQLHAEYAIKYETKKQLVEKAEEIANGQEYTRENTAQMKALSAEWKTVGSCGKDKENQIWKLFCTAMDNYFDGLRQFNDQKHEQWHQRMLDVRSSKQDQIQNQQRQIKHMQSEMVGLLGERAINEMAEMIEDKKALIKQLEAELADIDKTITQ